MRVILKKTVEAKINEAIEAIQDKDTIDYVELTRAEIAELAFLGAALVLPMPPCISKLHSPALFH